MSKYQYLPNMTVSGAQLLRNSGVCYKMYMPIHIFSQQTNCFASPSFIRVKIRTTLRIFINMKIFQTLIFKKKVDNSLTIGLWISSLTIHRVTVKKRHHSQGLQKLMYTSLHISFKVQLYGWILDVKKYNISIYFLCEYTHLRMW